MNAAANYDDLEFFSADEAAKWCGVSLATFFALLESESIPAPCSVRPLRWREQDFYTWASTQDFTGT